MALQHHEKHLEKPERQDSLSWEFCTASSNLFEAINCFESLSFKSHYTLYNQDFPDEAIAYLRLDAPAYPWSSGRRRCIVEIGQIRQHDGKFVPFYDYSRRTGFWETDSDDAILWRWSFRIHDMYKATLSNLYLQGSTVTGVLTCDLIDQCERALPMSDVDAVVCRVLPKHVRVIIR